MVQLGDTTYPTKGDIPISHGEPTNKKIVCFFYTCIYEDVSEQLLPAVHFSSTFGSFGRTDCELKCENISLSRYHPTKKLLPEMETALSRDPRHLLVTAATEGEQKKPKCQVLTSARTHDEKLHRHECSESRKITLSARHGRTARQLATKDKPRLPRTKLPPRRRSLRKESTCNETWIYYKRSLPDYEVWYERYP